MQNSNNFFQLVAEFQKNIDWLNQILKGGKGDQVVIDNVSKPSITKDIADKWAAITAMTQGRVAYETKSQLPSTPPSGVVLAEVWNDPIAGNNGLYGYKNGWVKSPYDTIALLANAVSAADGFLDGVISRWEYTGNSSAKFWLDNPVYFQVKGSKGHRLPYPLEFELHQLQVAYVDDDIRDDSNALILQIVDRGFWEKLPPSPSRRVVVSMEYNGIWSSPDLHIDSLDSAMRSSISIGNNILSISISNDAARSCEIAFGDGVTDYVNEGWMGAQGRAASIQPFTVNGKVTLESQNGLWFDFGQARHAGQIVVQKVESIFSQVENGTMALIQGSKMLLLSYSLRNGTPIFHGLLGQQAAAVWAAQQQDKRILSSVGAQQIPITKSMKVTKNSQGVTVTVPSYCYAAFPRNALTPESGSLVLRTGESIQNIRLEETEICFFDCRNVDENGRLIVQKSSIDEFVSQSIDYAYRRVLVWHTYSGYFGQTIQEIEWLSTKIGLSHYICIDDAKVAPSNDGKSHAIHVHFRNSAAMVWQAYIGGALQSVEFSDELKNELTEFSYVELKENQGLLVDLDNLNQSGRAVIRKVDNFYHVDVGRNDSSYLALGFRTLNGVYNFFGVWSDKVERFFDYNSGFYPQLDRVAFSQDNSVPVWDALSCQLTWSGTLLLLTPWFDERGNQYGRLRLQPGSITIPKDNYYVVWIDKRDVKSTDDALGISASKIKIGRYYEDGGWQGGRNACVIGYCSYGKFTRVAFPPVKGTLEYPGDNQHQAQRGPDVIIDVITPTSDLQRIKVNLRDDGNELGRYIQWIFERKTDLSPNMNSDVWHLQRAYVVSSDLNVVLKEVITGGENETAVRESGKADFCGGTAHGDEITQWVNMQVDGNIIDPTVSARYVGKCFRVQQESQLYEEGTQASVEWFKAWKTWEFSINGVEISQRLEFQRDANIDSFYNCFLCVARNEDSDQMATTAQFGCQSPKYIQHDLRSRTHSVYQLENVTHATAFGGGVHYNVEFLEGYGPQDSDKITYNPKNNYMFYQYGGSAYNKMYFRQGFSKILAGAKTHTKYRYQITSSL